MTRRRLFVLIHRCNGLLLAGFLTVAGTTGAALAWRVPLERVFAPQLFVPPNHPRAAPRADPLYVRQQVQRAFPQARVDTADLSASPDAPLEFFLTARSRNGAITGDDDVFADPTTGKVLGSRRYGDIRQGLVNFIPFVYRLHEELALGSLGTTCLGLAALLWTIDCFVGLYLSFPNLRRAWSSFKVRWRAKGFRRLYDLHRASGVWLWLLLLIFAWTGVAFNLPGIYQPVMQVFGSHEGRSDQAVSCQATLSSGEADVWASALAAARNRMKAESERRHFGIRSERFLSYEPEICRWTYRVRSTLDVDLIGNTQLVWNKGLGLEAVFSAPTGETAADTFTTWMEAIHEAQTGGPVVRWLVCCGGLVTAFLSATGVLIFVRKMRF